MSTRCDPTDADVWHNKGNALYSLGKYDEAQDCYDKALEYGRECF